MRLDFITQFEDHVGKKSNSQLIKDIPRVLQKLLGYFNGTIISTSFVPLLPACTVNLSLSVKESVAALLASNPATLPLFKVDSALKYCHKLPDVFE